ncbi:eukaryotic translation initiation factor 4 gamma-like [Lathyrus oleraceus]|uniref:eukaryotic translation initiation factor 4 gamma-like n=1 Tax=Pisum sativum TaxID=3888 RepID=UPI0021CEA98F|nr:eukaryotic translation initiation factor 4 gamma-like [Pisum sativum]
MTSKAFKLKGLSEEVRNDFIRDAEIRLQERLAREAEERAHKEAEEKAKQEELQRIKEAEAKALADAAAAAEAEVQAKAAVEAEARLTEESATRVEQDALTQGESSTFVPLDRALSAQNQPEPETNIPSPSEQPPTLPSEPHIETPTENPITHQSEPLTENIPTPPALTSPTSEPEPTFPTLEEVVALFVESSIEKIRSLSENSRINDDPSVVRIH